MLEDISGDTIAAEVEMIRTAFTGTIVILEGNTDSKLFNPFFDKKLSQILVAHGKDNALSAISILNNSGHNGIVSIVDSDLWRIEGQPELPSNVLTTDTHDSEGMLFISTAFERVVSEYCSNDKTDGHDDLRSFFYVKSKTIGSLRLLSIRQNLNLVFNNIDYEKFTSKNDLNIDIDKMIRHINQLTQKNAIKHGANINLMPDATILHLLNDTIDVVGDLELVELCCGHDLIGLFSLSLRKLFATLKATLAEYDNVTKIFRLSFSVADFVSTNLFARIVHWERTNEPFKVLRQNIIPEQGAAH